ncbi:DUF3098 domain-containing protein [Spirosoma validum]|uniref:DUF3098 domain-containing protein n=1 Tax=Spirosoma validum TaxID=2771355 RepID=A0A927AZ49_9BACT|nr:DUF3098 domain-containing protein [Spirosoma validum]MBD2752416.1 DUF3098 domain-containing protein [Spirosoma validum]
MAKDKQYSSATLAREEAAKKAPVTPSASPKMAPIRSTLSEPTRPSTSAALPFGQQNYVLMLAGIGIILAGFFIMSLDKEEFGFGFLGLTLGPIVVMGGFVVEFFAILARPKA